MSSKDKQIMVVNKDILFKDKTFDNFCQKFDYDYKSIINDNFIFKPRSEVENDFNYLQPIPYILIVELKTNKIFMYQRFSSEKRLYKNFSIGIGGHIEQQDLSDFDFFKQNAIRELNEELKIIDHTFDEKYLEHIGYIYTEENDVCKVHFGLVYFYFVPLENISILSTNEEISNYKMIPMDELEKESEEDKDNKFEIWTKIALKEIG